jgi:signal recognition particle subunit SRP54
MLEKLGEAIKKATNKIANAIFLDKNLIDSIIRDLQRALIEADVNIQLIKELSNKIRKASIDERIKNIDKKEHLIKLLNDELKKILGEGKKLEFSQSKQNIIMLLGLYGSGKTTTIAKLGNYYAKRGKKVILVGLDVHRPAAKEQLKQMAEKVNLNYFVDLKEKNAIKTWKNFKKKEKIKDYDLILIDTAGRHTLDKHLIKEIKEIKKETKPTETILVLPADIGQAAKAQASQFKEALDISGIIITRMDSSAKGGGALTACAEISSESKISGIYFITNGEKISDIEEFDSEKFLSRLLGIGDLSNLIEKIKSITDLEKQKKLESKIKKGKLSLNDVVDQVKSMNSLGGFSKIKNMIPGFNSAKISEETLENQNLKIAKWEHIIKSMTLYERENPEIFDDKKTGISRINRISKGSGVNNSEIRSLLKQYKMLNEIVKESSDLNSENQFSQKSMQKLMKKFGKKKMIRF